MRDPPACDCHEHAEGSAQVPLGLLLYVIPVDHQMHFLAVHALRLFAQRVLV